MSALEPSGWKRTAEAARSPSVKPLAQPGTGGCWRRWLHASRRPTQAERRRQGPSHHAPPAILLEPRLRQVPQIPTRRIAGDRKIGIFPPFTHQRNPPWWRGGAADRAVLPSPQSDAKQGSGRIRRRRTWQPSWCDDGQFWPPSAPSGFATKLETALTPPGARSQNITDRHG